jgi:flagellar protein FlaJ
MSSASTETTAGDAGTALLETVTDLRDAYDEMPMANERYLLLVLAPAVFFAVVLVVASVVLPLPLVVVAPMILLGGIVVLSAAAYPKLYVEQWSHEIENEFHLLVTHMTVLSTTNIDRMEVFRKVAAQEEYGAIAEEVRRVVQLVDTWNQSLDDACRRRAREVPSEALADYFDRLAYSLGAGQGLDDFLMNEQEVIMAEYGTLYESALNNLDVMKDLYLSMVLSMTFGLVFAIVLPILTGTNPTITVSAVIVLYVFIQVGFFVALRTTTPSDPLWYHPEETEARMGWQTVGSAAVGVVLSVALAVVVLADIGGFSPVSLGALLGMDPVPFPVYAAIPTTPLVIPGLVGRLEETRIKSRDEEFPNFIRALGASESAKQSTSSAVLEDLRKKDFGALTETMDNLYRRLNMRVSPDKAWDLFAVEARSYLIQKFSGMYREGRQMGGEPKKLGELISENANQVLQLRQRRSQETITLIGLLYGITAASTFAFFIGLAVVDLLSGLNLGVNSSSSFDFNQIINTQTYDIPQIELLLTGIILFNAALSSLMIRTVDGGNKITSLYHFTTLTWLGSLTAVATQVLTATVVNI